MNKNIVYMHVYILSMCLSNLKAAVATASRNQFLHQITDNLSKGSCHL